MNTRTSTKNGVSCVYGEERYGVKEVNNTILAFFRVTGYVERNEEIFSEMM